MRNSIVLNTDSYKVSMWKQYPPGTEYVYSYIESRGGLYKETVFLGIQAFIREYLVKPVTQAEVDFADKFWTAHGEPFNKEGWDYIVSAHNGILPIEIKAVDEGTVVETKNILASVRNTDPKLPWLTTWVETTLLRAIWYPTTVATQSWSIKQLLLQYLNKSGTPEGVGFMLHDFGARGVSSFESAGLGAMAHLVNFMGTDTVTGILAANEYYDADITATGFSIPAAEHSTITSWGRGSESLAYANMVKQFSKPGSIYAVVSDSYDIYNAAKMWGTELKDLVISSGGTLVIRPDSGDPVEVMPRLLAILDVTFGSVKNVKGYKKLNNVKLIWGDGINELSINSILRTCVDLHGFSADNFAFGMGGALLQGINRDTLKFAMKCSAIAVRKPNPAYNTVWQSGQSIPATTLKWVDVFKDPVTDPGKVSKKGIMKLIKTHGPNATVFEQTPVGQDLLKVRFHNGIISNETTFEAVRARSNA